LRTPAATTAAGVSGWRFWFLRWAFIGNEFNLIFLCQIRSCLPKESSPDREQQVKRNCPRNAEPQKSF
jgi:hypothetical protein